jgi:hypothetical protein
VSQPITVTSLELFAHAVREVEEKVVKCEIPAGAAGAFLNNLLREVATLNSVRSADKVSPGPLGEPLADLQVLCYAVRSIAGSRESGIPHERLQAEMLRRGGHAAGAALLSLALDDLAGAWRNARTLLELAASAAFIERGLRLGPPADRPDDEWFDQPLEVRQDKLAARFEASEHRYDGSLTKSAHYWLVNEGRGKLPSSMRRQADSRGASARNLLHNRHWSDPSGFQEASDVKFDRILDVLERTKGYEKRDGSQSGPSLYEHTHSIFRWRMGNSAVHHGHVRSPLDPDRPASDVNGALLQGLVDDLSDLALASITHPTSAWDVLASALKDAQDRSVKALRAQATVLSEVGSALRRSS